MMISKIASIIYQAAKKEVSGKWIWTTEWSKAMKKAWDKMKIKKKISSLKEKINIYNFQYHILDIQTIPDKEYDQLFYQLLALEDQFPELVTSDSPSRKVGGDPLKKFEKVEHSTPMLSLNSFFDANQLHHFTNKIQQYLQETLPINYIIEPKIDGLAVELVYENGFFVQGSTRGNGKTGEDITAQLQTVQSIPLRLHGKEDDIPTRLIIRGEIFLYNKDYLKINKERAEKGKALFSSARSAAAASVRQLDPKITATRPLQFYAHGVTENNDTCIDMINLFNYIKKLGIPVNPLIKCTDNPEEIKKIYQYFQGVRSNLKYDIDGMVIKVSNLIYQKKLGNNSRAPRWAIAWKFS